MRQMIPVGLALVGMALAAPAAATAGSPDTRPGLFARKARRTPPPQVVETMPTVQPASAVHVHTDGVRCPICEAAAAAPPVVMMGACSACENGSTTVHNHPMIVEGEAPGLASLGPAEAPGYARLGGATNATPVYAEPTPIGVMQAGYQPAMQPQGMQGGPVDVLALSKPVRRRSGRPVRSRRPSAACRASRGTGRTSSPTSSASRESFRSAESAKLAARASTPQLLTARSTSPSPTFPPRRFTVRAATETVGP